MFLALTLAAVLAAAAASPCAEFEGQWSGFSNGQPLAETYTASWTNATARTFTFTNNKPGADEWTHAAGHFDADDNAFIYFPEKAVYLVSQVPTNKCTYLAWNNTSEWARQGEVDTVHLLFLSHLDVGACCAPPCSFRAAASCASPHSLSSPMHPQKASRA